MNDERGLFGKGGIGEEGVGFSDLNEGLELGFSKLRSDYAKMGVEDKVDEFKKKSRSRPLEMKAGFDGDDEPIGSFFKLKKRPRNGAKSVKSGDNGRIKVAKSVNSSDNGGIRVGVEKPRVKEEDSGEMEDTLASFKKKLKAPKRVKGGGSGVVKEKDEVGPSDRSYIGSLKDGAGQAGAILDEGLEDSVQKLVRKPWRASDEVGGRKHSDEAGASDQSLIGSLKDGAGPGGLKDFVQKRGRKSRCALMRKKNGDASGIQESQSTSLEEQKKGDVGFGESVDHSSDDNLELSLSEFVRKSYSCSVRKARSTSIQKRTNDGISTDLAPMLGQRLHSASPSKLTKEMVKSEGKFILPSDVISKRKSRRASVAKLQEGNAKFDEQLDQDFNENSEESLPAGVGKTYSDIVPKDTVENQRSDDGSSRNSNLIKKDSFGCPVQEDCSYTFPDITEVTVKLTEEVHKCEDGLKQCFNEKSSDSLYGITKISNFVSDLKHTEETNGFDENRLNKHANEISVDLSSSLVIMSSPVVPAHAEEHPESKNVLNKLSDGTCIQVQNPCSVNAVKITEDTIRSDDGLNRSSNGDPEVQISSAILKSCSASFLVPRKEIPSSCFNDYPFNGPCEEIDKESAPDCDDCLNKLPLHVEKLCSAYNKNEAEEGTGYDELAEPVGGNLKCSLSSLVRNSPLNSMTMKTGDIPLPDGLNKYSDGFLKDFQFVQLQTSSSASGTMKKEETNSCSDGLSQTLDVAIEDSLIVTEKKPHLAPVDMQMEQTGITGDELKRFSDTTLSVSPSVDDEKSDFATPLCPKEELASIGDVFNHFSCGLVVDSTTVSQKRDSANLQTPSTVDASKEPSSAPIEDTFVEEAKTSCCQSIMQDVNEFYLEDVRKASDAEIKEKTLLTMQREVRKIKKPRHGDMAYEGDIDWEVLMQQQGFFENNPATDEDWSIRTKDKSDSPSNMLAEADVGGAAAVAAGLKAHAVGPVEKIKFKEFLKRRGGLQEYLECRNLILALWNKDVSRILPLIDCGVTEAPLENESPRSSIIREIYAFLDHSGYINVGIASEKQVARPCGMSHLKLSKENLLVDSFGGRVPDSEDEDAFILAKVKNSDNLIAAKNNGSFGDGVLASTVVKEDVRSKKLSVSNTHTEFSIMGVSAECAVGNMDIDTQLSRVACVPGCLGGEKAVPINKNSGLKVPLGSESCTYVPSDQEDGCRDAQVPNGMTKWDNLNDDPSCGVVDSRPDTVFALEQSKVADSKLRSIDIGKERAVHAKITGIQSTAIDPSEVSNGTQYDSEVGKRIIVIGAGPAGLTAARHLQRQGFSVMILEARNRIGGRVYTDRVSLSVPVDLGASIITGVEADMTTERRPDPSSLLCAQLGLELTVLNSECPLYDTVTGEKVPSDLDEALEAEYNSLLDDMVVFMDQNCEVAMRMSLEDGLAYALTKRRMARSMVTALESDEPKVSDSEVLHMSMNASVDTKMTNGDDNRVLGDGSSLENILSPLERRVMNWHFANLEYGCAALLKEVSLPYWNQDDVYGGFGGAHCMIKGGYSTVLESLGKGLHIHLNHVVTEVTYGMDSAGTHGQQSLVNVHTSSGSVFVGDAVLITVPLGCLKANAIKFSPVLPEWKQSSIQRLGFGVLNKVVLEFPEVFWDDTVDYFGATAEETGCRGQCFMFWNVKKTAGAPVLIALVVGKAAIDGQYMSTSEHVNHALMVLRKIFGEASVPDPIASVVTNWGRDPFSRGAYSYVAVGASGEDYDILGRPVENCLFFAGEATCKEHPDTVGGAMMSGLREAVRIIDILSTGNDYTAEVEAMEAAQRQSDSERNEVRDLVKRLDAIELSNNLCKSSLNGVKRLTEEALLRDMFFNATTAAGRLHLAKKLLHLPVEVLKSFAGTKEGLSTLNSWIRDSMGKDGTQLLRHCVRLLVLVSTDLLAVRLSGIGKTVKERVCVHTSRDIRAVASQLVNMWIEVFRKEKAANGGLKVPRQTTVADSSKVKSKVLSSGKPPLRNEASDVRGTMQVPSSAGSYSPSGATNKKVLCTPVKLEALNNSKSGFNSSNSHNVIQSMDSTVDGSIAMSEEEAAAFAAAEAARNAALAAAEAYASSEADCNTLRELPKIPSFHKFARREQYTQMDDSDLRRRKWSGGVLGRQDCISEIDSRNCRVRNWSVDFPSACGNLDSSRMSGDNYTQRSNSNDIACHLNLREHSGESGAVDSSILTRAWVDSPGSWGIKDYHAIERWQSQAEAADPDFLDPTIHVRDEEESNKVSKLLVGMYGGQAEESSASQATENRGLTENHKRGAEHIKQAVVDYVTSLLMPLYKARKIDKEGYKSIMRKSATKVMDLSTEAEKVMSVTEFLDFKRRNKIRAFVDKLIERQMEINPNIKS